MNAKARLIQCAIATGFDLIGVCGPDKLSEAEEILTRRQEEGYLTPFTPACIEERVNPAKVFPAVKSIISVGLSYAHSREKEPNPELAAGKAPAKAKLSGRMARFARGRDYHAVLREKINSLMQEWQQSLGYTLNWAAYVDTGPLPDRAVAWRSGLGWYGKNCTLISPKFGSWFVLGEILVDIYLEPDQPLEGSCGECDRCLRACPAGALEEPYRLNAYHCVSYLTQAPGFIPRELRQAMGRQLYGCDLCQQVCPHNLLAEIGGNGELHHAEPHLEEFLALSNREFREAFGKTTAGWRGKKLLQRNAVIALGNSGSPEALPALIRAMADPRPEIRGHAAWALGQIGGPEAKEVLEQALAKELRPEVKAEIAQALQNGKV